MCASLARSTVLHPAESMKNIALGQEEVYSCAFWLLTMISLRNPWEMVPILFLFHPVSQEARKQIILVRQRPPDIAEGGETGDDILQIGLVMGRMHVREPPAVVGVEKDQFHLDVQRL